MGKKVNKAFLIGLTACIGGMAVAAFIVAGWYYARHTAAYYLKRADAAQAQGDWERAAGYTNVALNKDPSNKPLYIRLGDLCEKMVPKDQSYLGKAMSVYQRALEIDPTFTPAIDRLLAIYTAEMKSGGGGTSFFADLKRIADKGVAGDKTNPHYQALSHIASIQQWLYSSGHSNAQIDKEIEALDAVSQKDPQEADAAFYASQAQFQELRDLINNRLPDLAHAMLDKIAARHQAAIKARPQDPAVQMRAFQVFGQLSVSDDRKENRRADQQMTAAAIKAASDAAKPADEVFDDVKQLYASWLRSERTPRDQVVKIYADWMKQRPHDQRAALEMAEYLATDPSQRPQAIGLLSNPVTPESDLQGYAALQMHNLERQRLINLNSLRVDDAAALRGKARQDLLATIDGDLSRISSMGFGDNVPLLKLRGKVQMLKGNAVDAIKDFEKAQTLLGQNSFDLDLWSRLEQAYVVTGQTGTAVAMLEKLLARAPGATALRLQLAELYLQADQNDKAAEQVRLLDASHPTDPALQESLARLSLVVQARQHHTENAQKLWATLPEKTRDQRLFKARMAAGLDEPAEATRLYRDLLHENPADVDAVGGWISLLLHDKNNAQAKQVVDEALKAKPEEPRLKAMHDQLAANTPEARQKLEDDMAQQMLDPRQRALRQAQLAMDRQQWDVASKRLDDADRISPDDRDVLMARVQWYIAQRKFAEAAPVIDKAAAANADLMEGLAIRTRVALLRNDAADGLKWGNQLVGKYDQFSTNWLLLARAQQMAGQYSESINSCDAALQRQPNNIDGLKLKAECLESLAQFAQEKDVIAQASALAPTDLTLRDMSLNYELHHGDPDKVIASCEELIKKEPDNAAVYAATGQACEVAAQSKYRGDAAASHKLLERARDVLKQGMTQFASSPELARFYIPLSHAMEGLGDVVAAEDLLRKMADRPDQKDKPDASRELSGLYERHGRLEQAEQSLRDAYVRSGQSVDTELDLAQFYIRGQHFDDALNVLEAKPENPRVRNLRIEAMLSANRLAEARKLVGQYYSSTPTSAVALYYRGIIELNEADAATAVTDLASARDKDPTNPLVRMWLARALLAQDRRDDAVPELADVLRRNPLRDDARILLLEADMKAPPRWDQYDQVVQEAENNPVLSSNSTWHQLHARGLASRGLFDQAKQQIALAQKLEPNSFNLQEENINILVQAKEWPAVLSETDKELAAGHTEGFIFGKRALAHFGLGDKATAAKDFETGLASFKAANNIAGVTDLLQTIGQTMGPDEALSRLGYLPEGPTRYLAAIDLYGMKGDFANRIKNADLALAQADKMTAEQKATALRAKAEGYLVLSKLDPAHTQWDKAHQAFDDLLSLRPNDMSALNNVAYLMAELKGDPQAAKPYSTRAYNITMKSDQNPGVIDTQGWILTLCGDKDSQAGLYILERLVQSHENFTKARYHLAEAYLRQRLFARAGDQLTVVQEQMKQMQSNNHAVDDELRTGVPKALEEIRQKTGRASG